MEKVLVAELGVEGGGCSIYGRQADGSWSFWQEGSSVDFADEEFSRSWTSEPVPDLGLALPDEWPLFYAVKIHPDFSDWFRDHYQDSRESLRPELREMQAEHQHDQWARVLAL